VANPYPDRVKEDQRIGWNASDRTGHAEYSSSRASVTVDMRSGEKPMPYNSRGCTVISRVLVPRAYIEMILSSKPGKRHWSLAITGDRNLPCRSRCPSPCIAAIAVAVVVPLLLLVKMVIHLGIEGAFSKSLLPRIEWSALV